MANAGKLHGDIQCELKVTNSCYEGFMVQLQEETGLWHLLGVSLVTHTLSNCGAWVVPGKLVNNVFSKMEIHHF